MRELAMKLGLREFFGEKQYLCKSVFICGKVSLTRACGATAPTGSAKS
jgi:hypothetical protein